MDRDTLKQSIITTLEVFEEVRREREREAASFTYSSEDVIRTSISLYIQGSRNGNGSTPKKSSGNGGSQKKADGGNGGDGKEPKRFTVNFGKYKGQVLEDILKTDRSYVRWLAEKAKDETVRTESKKLLEQNPASTGKITIPVPKVHQ